VGGWPKEEVTNDSTFSVLPLLAKNPGGRFLRRISPGWTLSPFLLLQCDNALSRYVTAAKTISTAYPRSNKRSRCSLPTSPLLLISVMRLLISVPRINCKIITIAILANTLIHELFPA
jgi:hypothetical protein